MPEPEVKVEGLTELVRDLRRAKDKELDDELKAAQREGAEIVATAARPLVPRASGALLGTVRATATMRSGRVAAGKKAVPYANPIHWGWPRRGIEATPFLVDALNLRRESVLDLVAAGVERVTDRIGDKAVGL